MIIREILQSAQGIEKTDVELLLAQTLNKNRAWILGHEEQEISENEYILLENGLRRLRDGEPIQYVLGETEFCGWRFFVSPDVLIPRPSTEVLVEMALNLLQGKSESVRELEPDIIGIAFGVAAPLDVHTLVDIGTGSGCIAISLALAKPDLQLIATDISQAALEVAKKNAQKFSVEDRIQFLHGKNLEPVKNIAEPFLIVSNPPYIPSGRKLSKRVSNFEPKEALWSGEDGLDCIRRIVPAALAHPYCRGIVLECEADQKEAVTRLAEGTEHGTTMP